MLYVESIKGNILGSLYSNNNDKYIDVFPVYLSPNINYLYPLPTGNILSTILSPVIRESFILKTSFQQLLITNLNYDEFLIKNRSC